MKPQNSFIQKLIVPFLIGMWILAAYFVYRNNPEIMNPEPYYKVLMKDREASETRIVNPEARDDIFIEKGPTPPDRLSHRYTEMPVATFQPLRLSSNSLDWGVFAGFLVAKESTKLTVADLTGQIMWSLSLPKGSVFSNGPLAVLGEVIYLSTSNGQIYALNIANGKVIWYSEDSSKYFHSPIAAGDLLLLFNEEKVNQNWSLILLDAKFGEYKQRYAKLEMPLAGEPLVKTDMFYFATQNGHLNALDLKTGKIIWTSEASSGFQSGPALVNDRLYVTNEDGLALAFDKKSGRKVNEIETGALIHEPIQAVENTNFGLTTDTEGYLIAFDLRSAKRLWKYNLNMGGAIHRLQLVRLSQQSLTQINFNSDLRGWTAWVACNSTRICIFDVKEGQLLHRLDLKGKPLGRFELVGNPAHLYVPVERAGRIEIIGLSPPPQTPVAVSTKSTDFAGDTAAKAKVVETKIAETSPVAADRTADRGSAPKTVRAAQPPVDK